MAEALRTFAIVADAYDPPEDDDDTEAWDHRFCIGDLRRAHEALSVYEAAKKEAEEINRASAAIYQQYVDLINRTKRPSHD